MNRTLTIWLSVVLVALGGIFTYTMVGTKVQGQQDEPVLKSSVSGNGVGLGTTASDSDIRITKAFGLLSSLRAMQGRFNTDFFTKAEFTSLQDQSQPLPSAGDVGRPNPFAPIGIDIGTIPQDGPGFGGNTNTGTPTGGTGGTPPGGGTTSDVIETGAATTITRTGATITATLTTPATAATTYFAYGTTSSTTLRSANATVSATNTFSTTLSGLAPNTTYYVKGVMEVGGITLGGNTITFRTLP